MYYIIDNIVTILALVVLIIALIGPTPEKYIIGIPFLIFYNIYNHSAERWRMKKYDK